MIFIWMIITTLVPVALAKGSLECNLSEITSTVQCFGKLGEPLSFHLPTNVKKAMLKKNETDTILNIGNTTVIPHKDYESHSVYFPNGTFRLNNAQRNNSGDYQLRIFGSDGELLHTISMHLEIQAPVSAPAVSQVCPSPERMNISCSCEGDGVELVLTLDGHFLMETRDHSHTKSSSTGGSVSNITIGLHGQLTGHLVCNVQNNISREETVIHLTSCGGSVCHFSQVAVAAIASVTTLLLNLALFIGIKYMNKKTKPMPVNEDIAEDEIIYSDVRVMRHHGRTRPNSHQNTT